MHVGERGGKGPWECVYVVFAWLQIWRKLSWCIDLHAHMYKPCLFLPPRKSLRSRRCVKTCRWSFFKVSSNCSSSNRTLVQLQMDWPQSSPMEPALISSLQVGLRDTIIEHVFSINPSATCVCMVIETWSMCVATFIPLPLILFILPKGSLWTGLAVVSYPLC